MKYFPPKRFLLLETMKNLPELNTNDAFCHIVDYVSRVQLRIEHTPLKLLVTVPLYLYLNVQDQPTWILMRMVLKMQR